MMVAKRLASLALNMLQNPFLDYEHVDTLVRPRSDRGLDFAGRRDCVFSLLINIMCKDELQLYFDSRDAR